MILETVGSVALLATAVSWLVEKICKPKKSAQIPKKQVQPSPAPSVDPAKVEVPRVLALFQNSDWLDQMRRAVAASVRRFLFGASTKVLRASGVVLDAVVIVATKARDFFRSFGSHDVYVELRELERLPQPKKPEWIRSPFLKSPPCYRAPSFAA